MVLYKTPISIAQNSQAGPKCGKFGHHQPDCSKRQGYFMNWQRMRIITGLYCLTMFWPFGQLLVSGI